MRTADSGCETRWATALAALFNVIGMPMQLAIVRGTPAAGEWAPYFSIAVGVAILAILLRARPGRGFAGGLFVINAAVVALALWSLDGHYDGQGTSAFPFQPTKLAALVAGMLAPAVWAGMAAIAIHVGSSVLRFFLFPPAVRAAFHSQEPWALLAFGIAGAFILLYRARVRRLEMEMRAAHAEIESSRRLAEAFVDLRDRMNTPIQSIEIAVELLETEVPERKRIARQLHQSFERLREINELLKRYEPRDQK